MLAASRAPHIQAVLTSGYPEERWRQQGAWVGVQGSASSGPGIGGDRGDIETDPVDQQGGGCGHQSGR
jgi:hypothetical protein